VDNNPGGGPNGPPGGGGIPNPNPGGNPGGVPIPGNNYNFNSNPYNDLILRFASQIATNRQKEEDQ